MTVSVQKSAQTLDLTKIRADFPILEPGDARRKPVGLPGFRRHIAAAAAGPRRRTRLPHHLQRRRAPRCAPADGGVHRRLRAGPRRHRGVRRRRRERAGVHQERHRGHQPGRLRAGGQPLRACGRPGRRHRHHRAGAPRQPGAVAGVGPSHRRDVEVVLESAPRAVSTSTRWSWIATSKSLHSAIIRMSPGRWRRSRSWWRGHRRSER